MKSQMKIHKRGETRTINCHAHERQTMAGIARTRRRLAQDLGHPRPTLQTIRQIAAARYA